jgi:outer membrane protein OmpA-like peptidoglycan-associated protein
MIGKIILISMSLAFSGTAVRADAVATTGENIGVGSGIAVGGLAAGPVGAILGAVVGGFIGIQVERARLADNLEAELAMAESEAADLRSALAATRADLSDSEYRLAALQRRPAPSAGLEMEVLFRTGSSELDIETEQRLVSLAAVLDRDPDLVVTLDGYADRRGDEDLNLRLSEARAEAVRQTLIEHGFPAQRIASQGHGDAMSTAGEGDLDAYALERNVRIRLDMSASDTQIAQRD